MFYIYNFIMTILWFSYLKKDSISENTKKKGENHPYFQTPTATTLTLDANPPQHVSVHRSIDRCPCTHLGRRTDGLLWHRRNSGREYQNPKVTQLSTQRRWGADPSFWITFSLLSIFWTERIRSFQAHPALIYGGLPLHPSCAADMVTYNPW